MIIRNNLASNPVKNHTLFFLGCLVLLAGTVLFTVFNFRSLTRNYLENRKLESETVDEQKHMSDLRREADAFNGRITGIKTLEFVKETEFVNDAIRKRVFSWTTLFDQLEGSLPGNVKMVSVIPAFSSKDVMIQMEVAGRGLNDIVDLIRRLQASPVFSDVFFMNERADTDGLHVTINLRYSPQKAEALKNGADKKGAVKQPETAAAEGDEQ